MVQDIVHVDLDALGVRGVDEGLEVSLSSVQGVDRRVIVNVISVIGRSGMRRREPQSRGPDGIQVVQLGDDALEVADTVAVAVGEGIYQQLVGGRRTLVAVECGGLRGKCPDVGAGLRHRDIGLLRPVEGNGAPAFVRGGIGFNRNCDGAVGTSGSLVQMYPAGGCRCCPRLGRGHQHQFVGGVVGLEFEGSRRHGERRRFGLDRLVAGDRGAHQDRKEDISELFHTDKEK